MTPEERWHCTKCGNSGGVAPGVALLDPHYSRGSCPTCGHQIVARGDVFDRYKWDRNKALQLETAVAHMTKKTGA